MYIFFFSNFNILRCMKEKLKIIASISAIRPLFSVVNFDSCSLYVSRSSTFTPFITREMLRLLLFFAEFCRVMHEYIYTFYRSTSVSRKKSMHKMGKKEWWNTICFSRMHISIFRSRLCTSSYSFNLYLFCCALRVILFFCFCRHELYYICFPCRRQGERKISIVLLQLDVNVNIALWNKSLMW